MSGKFFSKTAPRPVGAYPHAREAAGLLFLSGVGPRDPQSGDVPGNRYDNNGSVVGYDFEAQCRAVFENVRAVLTACGARWEDLIDVTVFLTHMESDFETYNRLYAEYFRDVQPCRTTVEIKSLPTPIRIELKCIAERGDQ